MKISTFSQIIVAKKAAIAKISELCSALEEIKKRQLYRSKYPSFKAYCQDKGYDRRLRELEQDAQKHGVDLSKIGYKNPIED